MIRGFCLYKQRIKIPLLISQFPTVLLSGTDLYLFLAVLIQWK